MRPYEIILGLLTTLTAGSILIFKQIPRLKKWALPALLVLGAGLQLTLEGFRWQLWPLFLAAGLLILTSLIKFQRRGQIATAVIVILLTLVSLTAAAILPVPDPFPITGPYQVGTREIQLVDPNRLELYGPDPAAPREFMAQIWYPAEPQPGDQQAQWMPAIEYAGPAIARMLGLPPFTLGHLKYVQANAYLGSPPSGGDSQFPVLIFSHGWEGFKEQNIYQVEELASQGYVVVGINHTYGAILSVFPDGRQVPINHQALPSGVSDEVYDQASNTLVKQWAGDIGFTLDKLEKFNQEEDWFLSGRMDLNEVGVFGHSTGAGATIEFCLVDARCQAALAMDLWAEPAAPEIQELRLSPPALIMHSSNWDGLDTPEQNYGLIGTLVERAAGPVDELTIQGTKHYDFSSLPLMSPLAPALGLKGPIDGKLVLEIINAETVAFFDRTLKGDASASPEAVAEGYPEVQWGVRP